MANLTISTEILRSTAIDEYRLLELSQLLSISNLEYGVSKSISIAEGYVTLLDVSAEESQSSFMFFLLTGRVTLYASSPTTYVSEHDMTAPATLTVIGAPLNHIRLWNDDADVTATYTYLIGD